MGKDTVLVADDIEFGRGILKMLLRPEYDVLEAADGKEAIARLDADASRISCVLLDIKMPGVDGYGVMDYMRDKGLASRIPVIALTSISDPQGHIRCYESGAIDLIEKPYNEKLLLYKIRWNINRFRRTSISVSPLQAVKEHCRSAFALETDAEVESMATSFMRTFGKCAAYLRRQAPAPDFGVVRDVTHDLCGFAANSGAHDLADLSIVLNACANAHNAKATSAAIRRVLALYDSYCA